MAPLIAGHQTQRPRRRSIVDDELLVAHPTTGKELEALINGERPDIILLDWTLPDVQLRELIDRLRTQPEANEIPIVVLTFRGAETRRICVLSTNGADRTVKSTEWPSLMARVQAALRSCIDDEKANRIRIGDIEIDRPARKVRRGRRDVPLSPTEYQLLEFFMRNPRRVLSRSHVLNSVWQPGSHIGERTVDAHVARLRQALVRGRQRDPIRTVRGAGYSFEGK